MSAAILIALFLPLKYYMKHLILIAFLFSGIASFAQTKPARPIVLGKGQKISVTNTNTASADMGMGMQMKNNSVSNSTITVTGENEGGYTLTNTITKLKASIEAMGETHDYDSDKESDRNSEMGKSMSDVIGKPVNVTVNKFTGTATFEKKDPGPEKPEENPMDDIMAAFGNSGDDPSVAGAFLLIPSGKKAGDSWTETDSAKGSHTVKSYTINSIVNNIASVSFTSSTNANNTMEVKGSQMEVTMSTKSKGLIIADMKTSLVSKRSTDSDISGTIDIMGQSMPVTATSHLVSEYTIQ